MPSASVSRQAHRIQPTLWNFRGRWLSGREAVSDEELINDCVALYSGHYGTWGPQGPSPGAPIRITPRQLRSLLDDKDSWLACTYVDERLIGYCVAVRTHIPNKGRIAWVSQLVVHRTYRNARVATNLLYSIWQFSDCYAWGLVTANPLAIRALETATRRRCRSAQITARSAELLEHVQPHVPYLPPSLLRDAAGRPQPRVDTRFFIDRDEVVRLQQRAARGDRPWELGHLGEGEEWFGCTFADQPVHALDDRHVADLLTGADSIWIQAYEGMTMDGSHRWHQHQDSEIDWILGLMTEPPSRVLDVGCGDGRHVKELIARDIDAVGIDISKRLIGRAQQEAPADRFAVVDARKGLPDGLFDLVLCLYDVIGSSAKVDDDEVLLRNVRAHLAPGGILVLSVMNTTPILRRLPSDQRPRTNSEFLESLERLRPSSTMEKTGAVFDPELLLYYDGVYYRKEQFVAAEWRLPAELVVRDRRFSSDDVRALLFEVGLEPMSIRPVRAGGWTTDEMLTEGDPRAKELLVVARRPTVGASSA